MQTLQKKWERKSSNPGPVTFNQILPHNWEAEQCSLNACLCDPEATDRALEFIGPDDFFKGGSKELFKKLCAFRDMGMFYTPSSVIASFKGSPEFNRIEDFIFSLSPFVLGDFSRHYAKLILDMSVRRKIIEIFADGINLTFEVLPDAESILTDTLSNLADLRARLQKKRGAKNAVGKF